jgi:hypothetical protein
VPDPTWDHATDAGFGQADVAAFGAATRHV